MSIKPYPIQVYRKGQWTTVQTDHLLPGDLISITRQSDESPVPVDCLLLDGSCIANEAMLSGESTPQMKESIALRDKEETLDLSIDKNHGRVFFLEIPAT
jgi:cation-transporting ATPase 13A1